MLNVDTVARITSLAKMKEIGVLNSNQIAAIENLPTMGDQGERRYVPANWLPLDDDGLPAAAPGATTTAPTPPPTDGARQAILQSIRHTAEHLIGYEAKAVEQAAGREKNFLSWMDEFYGSFQSKLLQAVLHDCEALAAVLDRHDGMTLAQNAVAKHVAASTAILMELAGSTKLSLFADTVAAAVVHWPRRCEAFIAQIERLL